MTTRQPMGLAALGLVTPLGSSPREVARALFMGTNSGLIARDDFCLGRTVRVGEVTAKLPSLPQSTAAYECRNNRLMLAASTKFVPLSTRRSGAMARLASEWFSAPALQAWPSKRVPASIASAPVTGCPATIIVSGKSVPL